MPSYSTLSAAALLLAGLQGATAQTFTDCNPLTSTTCLLTQLWARPHHRRTKGASSDWTLAAGTTMSTEQMEPSYYQQSHRGPTISSDKYIFFGKVDAVVRAAPGVGIVSSFILESDDLDEIDWEWLGGADTSVESNFFGKGNTSTYDRAIYHNVADPIGTWHTYTIDWTSAAIKWSIDGNLVRTLNYADSVAVGGKNFPQTPMKIKMGNWVGCADAAANQPSSPTYGTCQWAGGPADFSKVPFTMYVKTVTIQDYSCGSQYTYGDTSGSYQSIKISGSCNGKAVSSSAGGSSSTPSTSSSTSGGVFAQSSTSSSSGSSTVSSSATSTGSANSTIATTMSTATGSTSGAKSTSAGSTATTSSSSTTTSSSPSTVSSSSASTTSPTKSKYGALDVAVIALGLTLGYFVM